MNLLQLLQLQFPSHKFAKRGEELLVPCPFCQAGPEKKKLSINLPLGGYWKCWSCGNKSKSIRLLFLRLGRTFPDNLEVTREYQLPVAKDLAALGYPDGFEFLAQPSTIEASLAIRYLTSRGFTSTQIRDYRLGYCSYGRYRQRIILPVYDDTELVYFTARSIFPEDEIRYLNPQRPADWVFGLDIASNYSLALLNEGPLSAIGSGPNGIAMFGKTLRDSQVNQILDCRFSEIILMIESNVPPPTVSENADKLHGRGAKVSCAALPENKDAADLDRLELNQVLANRQAWDWKFQVRSRL